MSNEKMATVSFRISEEEKTALAQYCQQHDLSMSWVLREAVRKYLKD